MSDKPDDLRVRTAQASMAMAGLTFLMRPISLVSSILLARWLLPEDFGVVAMAGILIGLAEMFTGLGLGNAVIHSQQERSKIAFYTFIITSLSGLIFFVIIVIFAVPFSTLLGDVGIAQYLQWYSALILLFGLTIIPSALLKKELLFSRVAQISVITQIIYVAVTLVLAYYNFGVWALIAGRLANQGTTLILTWFFCPGWDWLKPQPIDKKIFRDLLKYGLHTTSGRSLGYIIGNWDDWLVGRFLGTASLGFYRRAYDYMDKNVIQISGSIIGTVLLSTFAQIQENVQRLRRIYLKANRLIWLVIVPVSLGVFVVAPEAIPVLLGPNWSPMIIPLQIFSIMILTRAFSFNTSSLFSAIGKPEIVSRGAFILLMFMVPLALLLLRYDINGVAMAALISDMAGVIYFVYQADKVLPGTGVKTFSQGLPSLGAGILMVIGVLLSKPFILDLVGGQNNLLNLILLVAIGGIIYLTVALLTQRSLVEEVIKLAWDSLNSKGRLNRFLPKKRQAS